jgi:hypothetical protein
LRGLKPPDGADGQRPHLGINLDRIEPGGCQPLLQLDPLVKRQHPQLPRPAMLERRPAPDPVGQMPDPDHISICGVVLLQHLEVVEHQKRCTLCSTGQQHGRQPVIVNRAVDPDNPDLRPCTGHLAKVSPRRQVIKPLGQLHLDPPRLPLRPAEMLEIRRRGGQRIRRVIPPDIAPPVSVVIDRQLLERRGHELCVPHGSGP